MSSGEDSTTLINLRVIAKIKSGDKLNVADTRFFGIDQGLWSSITRWLRYDNRQRTLDRVEATLQHAAQMECTAALRELVDAAKNGLRELAKTYAGDPTTIARLEVLGSIPMLEESL